MRWQRGERKWKGGRKKMENRKPTIGLLKQQKWRKRSTSKNRKIRKTCSTLVKFLREKLRLTLQMTMTLQMTQMMTITKLQMKNYDHYLISSPTLPLSSASFESFSLSNCSNCSFSYFAWISSGVRCIAPPIRIGISSQDFLRS